MYRIILSAILIIIAGVINYPLHAACLSEPGNPGTSTSCGAAASNSISTQGNTSEVSSASSNPINAINGNKYQEEIDMPALPGEFGLELVRHYNSSLHAFGYTGYGWRLSYETDLFADEHTIQINQADGYRIIFTRDRKDPTICTPNDPARGTIVINKTAKGEEYIWIWANGRSLYFNHMGKLERITSASGQTMHFYRGLKGELIRVTDPQGRSMTFEYASKKSKGFRGIIAVNTPVGRYEYQHNDDKKSAGFGNLMSVKYPQEKIGTHGQNEEERKIFNNVNHVERHYHYGEITEVAENKNSLPNEQQAAHFLTGITVNWQDAEGKAQQQRINTWGYNAQGRAMFSVLGPYDPTAKKAGPGQLTLRFSNPDQYTEKDTQKQDLSKPQTPHGHHQHEHKSLVNTTILIDGLGQQTIVKHTVIAGQYRLIEVTGVGCSSCPENNMQYRYDNLARLVDKIKLKPDGKPLYIIRKSFDKASRVKEISRIDYANDKELPAQLLRRFEYPVLAQDKADFIQKAKGYEAAKLTQQTYAVYNQPNLIAMPSVVKGKEHQWRITYNQYGQPTQITETGYRPALPTDKTKAPILISRTLSYQYKQIDGKNLLAQIDGPLPNGKTNTPQDSDITQYQYDKLGRYLTQVIAPMNRFTTLSYDETNGLITSVINSAGQQTAINYANGLPTQITQWHESDATHKQTIQYQYDMFGNQIEQSVNNRPTMARGFDESGRLQWQANALGFLKQVTYDTEGKVLTSGVYSKNYAQVESYHYDAFNRLTQISDNAGRITNVKPFSSAHQSTKWAGYQSIVDDFGREIASISPTNNVDFRQYNVVNQLVEQTSSSGAKLKFTYNLAGQRTSQTVSSATQKPETTRWQYKNHQLLSIFHPNQDEYFQYSAQAQPSVHTVTLRLQDGNKVTHTTVYQYHSDGSLKSQSLPDGTWIEYQRNGQGQVTALTHQTSPRKIFGWGEQTIVKDLQRDITGLSHLTYGNGIEARWQRSQQGILARVVYTTPNTLNAKKQQLADIKHLMMPIADSLISKAYAQAQTNIKEKQTAQSYEPGALGLAEDPNAIFDARLLYDTRGNVLLQQQNGKGIQQSQAYAYDRRYQLVAKQSTPSRQMANEHGKVWRYHYDQFGNRVLAQENVMPNEMGDTIKTNYDTATGLAINTKTTKPFDTNQYNWNALGQLVSVKQGDQHIAQYRYNSTGLRVAKQINNKQGQQNTYTLYNMQRQRVADLNGQGEIVRQYIWLGDQLVATLDAKEPKRLQIPANGFASELSQTIQALWHSLINQQDKLAFVHVNHLHAPIAVTDTQTNVIWQADYAPYGELIKTGGSQPAYQLALRNAGQWQDDKTGLYYNDFRYYNPKTGRYISQDPLGKMAERLGSPNPYSYVNNNPISYIDPWGLVLFAFDGTGNTDDPNQLAALENGFSNVFNFRELYDDGNARYISGVGTIDYSDFNRPIDPKDYVPAIVKLLPFATTIEKDMAFNYSGRARIERMQEYFNAEADLLEDDNQAMDVDIIGFSRGAAQARDFANQIMKNTKQDLLGNNWYAYKDPQNRPQCQKVNFRFMGLWDTVLSTDAPLGTYNLHVPEAFQHVAHAIALNEHRGDTFRTLPGSTGAFPLESIVGGTIPANQTRIEKGFIGAHADIGGGFATKNQLAQVALAWMVKQAELAGVKMNDSSELHIISANPVIHDKSDNQYARDTVAKPADNNEDRTVTYQDVSTVKQKDMTTAGMTWLDTQNFITYNPPDVGTREILFNGTIKETYAEKPADASVGTVDMTAYLAWLKAHGYTLGDLQVQ
jgi:RHS repeat-associated protein